MINLLLLHNLRTSQLIRINYFLLIVDEPIASLTKGFEQLARWPALIGRIDLIKLSLYMTRYSSF
jgi:hypothetical protein